MEPLFSVRMRAAVGGPHEHGGRHLSGAERLVPEGAVDGAVAQMLRRARSRAVSPDFVSVTVERIASDSVERISGLPVTTLIPSDHGEALAIAGRLLAGARVSEEAVGIGFAGLQHGWVRSEPIRGAAMLDAATGNRVDPNRERGIRVSRLDYTPEAMMSLESRLHTYKLEHFRIREALAVASKVLWAGVLAEVCWSDDPEYTTGYVATRSSGYVRLTGFKPAGSVGGRAFFVEPGLDRIGLDHLIARLERSVVLIASVGEVIPPVSGSDLF